MARPDAGDQAPDFELEGTAGTFRLADQRGRKVVLVFYPGDDTMVCTKQLCAYTDQWSELQALDAVVVGISAKDLASKRAFAAKRGLAMPLLADPDRAVAALYGAKQAFAAKRGLAMPLLADPDRRVAALYGAKQAVLGTKRTTFVIDADGVIRFRHDAPLGLTFLPADELRAAIAAA